MRPNSFFTSADSTVSPDPTTFATRFAGPGADPDPPGLQLLYFAPPRLDLAAIGDMLRAQPEASAAIVELVHPDDAPDAARLITADGPPASRLGLVVWAEHAVQVVQFDAAMPYGPVESCVGPAMIPPPMKVDAKQHTSHVLLRYVGTHADALERFVALGLVAGVLARFDAIVVMNEEARAAVPAFDLIPDPGEDALATYRTLPIPYLLGGFVKMDAGTPDRPWVRTFASKRLGLPELATQLESHEQTADTFRLFAGILGYLRSTGEKIAAGDTLDLGSGPPLHLREPHEHEWFLESTGTMLVIES